MAVSTSSKVFINYELEYGKDHSSKFIGRWSKIKVNERVP